MKLFFLLYSLHEAILLAGYQVPNGQCSYLLALYSQDALILSTGLLFKAVCLPSTNDIHIPVEIEWEIAMRIGAFHQYKVYRRNCTSIWDCPETSLAASVGWPHYSLKRCPFSEWPEYGHL